MSSMEAAADEERRMVLELLEQAADKKQIQKNKNRPNSPAAATRSPVRSMLQVASSPASPRPGPRRMLDVDVPSSRPAPRSLLEAVESKNPPPKPASIAESSRSIPGPRCSTDSVRPPSSVSFHSHAPVDHTSEYQFSEIYTNNVGAPLPKRNTQGGKHIPSLLSDNLPEQTAPPVISLPDHSMRARSTSGASLMKTSKSPRDRGSNRSSSPLPNLISTPATKPGSAHQATLTLDSGRKVVTDKAYTILSDANLATAGIILGTKNNQNAEYGEGRLRKTYLSPDGDVILTDSSDADEGASSDEDNRGRKKTRSTNLASDAQKPQSLSAAAEEERVNISAQFEKEPKRSLLDPTNTGSKPNGGRHQSPRGTGAGSIHPATAYDEESASEPATPIDSDTEDIKRAQNLSFSQTGIVSQPESHRNIRIIYRGEYGRIQKEAKEDGHQLRKYLVASDLSDESTHALEWAVGTVLRDGDTLIAICCIDEESGIASGDSGLVPDEAKAMKDQAVGIREVTLSRRMSMGNCSTSSAWPMPSPGLYPADTLYPSPSPASPHSTSASEMERHKAVDLITDKITRLLRRTRLQVRVIVEVLHCKNPKHLITEIIDTIDPTLVILGSRGHSALKGVILGSFSNYLVTKSSVPVMVARKKLRKTGKCKKAPVKQVNLLEDPTTKSLSMVRID